MFEVWTDRVERVGIHVWISRGWHQYRTSAGRRRITPSRLAGSSFTRHEKGTQLFDRSRAWQHVDEFRDDAQLIDLIRVDPDRAEFLIMWHQLNRRVLPRCVVPGFRVFDLE